MNNLNKIISLTLSAVLLANNFAYAQSAGSPLKKSVEALRADSAALAKKGINLKDMLDGDILTLTSMGFFSGYITLESNLNELRKKDHSLKNTRAKNTLAQDVSRYAKANGDKKLAEQFARYLHDQTFSYKDMLLHLEGYEINENRKLLEKLVKENPREFKNLAGDMGGGRTLRQVYDTYLNNLRNHILYENNVQSFIAAKESMYIEIESNLGGRKLLRLREEIMASTVDKNMRVSLLKSMGKVRAAFGTKEYEKVGNLLKRESRYLNSGARSVLKRYALLGVAIMVMSAAFASENAGAVNRIKNNVSLILDADDKVLDDISKDAALADVLVEILDNTHAVLSSPATQRQYSKELQEKKKQINFNSRNNKFSSSGAKTGR
ncbi:hypothetical protein AAIR98_001235 [Elusimicrobium simillimum]|uniref:hypothetical protein n=1 Tax=Elusimicrobium simillimum TaxID=3143438 RepID=UPI003C6FB1EB